MREDDFAAGLVRMRPQDPAYDSLRVELQQLSRARRERRLGHRARRQSAQARRQRFAGAPPGASRASRGRRVSADSTSAAATPVDTMAMTAPTKASARDAAAPARCIRSPARRRGRRLPGASRHRRRQHARQETVDAMNMPARVSRSRRSPRTSSAIAGCRARSGSDTSS